MDELEKFIEKIKSDIKHIYRSSGEHIGDAHAAMLLEIGAAYMEIKAEIEEKRK